MCSSESLPSDHSAGRAFKWICKNTFYQTTNMLTAISVNVLQPLLDMANSGLSRNNDEEMVLALKALGNAGHPLSIKTLIKFLPGFSVKADSLPARVHSVAVHSLRHLAIRDPHSVSINTPQTASQCSYSMFLFFISFENSDHFMQCLVVSKQCVFHSNHAMSGCFLQYFH